jgi:hypothetical protein
MASTSAPSIESGEVIEPLRDRIVGRVSLENIKDPFGGQVIVHVNEEITEEKANEVQAAGIEKVRCGPGRDSSSIGTRPPSPRRGTRAS